jgi:hypothetical protein
MLAGGVVVCLGGLVVVAAAVAGLFLLRPGLKNGSPSSDSPVVREQAEMRLAPAADPNHRDGDPQPAAPPPTKLEQPAPPPKKDPGLEEKPAELVARHKAGAQHSVVFDAKLDLASRDPMEKDGPEHPFGAKFGLRYRETLEKIDDIQNKVTVRLDYEDCKFNLSYDREEGRVHMVDQEEVVKALSRATGLQTLTRLNRSVDTQLDFSKAAMNRDIEKSAANFHMNVTTLLRMISVPLPEQESVAPGDSWTTSVTISSGSREKGKGGATNLEMSYKYLGLRKENGKEVAVIALQPHLLSKKGREIQLKGDGDGEACIDLDLGIVRTAKLDLKLDLDPSMFVRGGSTSKSTGTLHLTLRRDLIAGK